MRAAHRPRRLAALAAWLALLAPAAAGACAVCGGGNPANRGAFFSTTVALSLLPLGLFAGGFLWLRARLAERARDEFAEREDGAPRAPSGPEPPATTMD